MINIKIFVCKLKNVTGRGVLGLTFFTKTKTNKQTNKNENKTKSNKNITSKINKINKIQIKKDKQTKSYQAKRCYRIKSLYLWASARSF